MKPRNPQYPKCYKYSKVQGVGHCVSQFSMAVIQYSHKTNFREKGFIVTYSSTGATVHHCGGRMTARTGS